MDAPLPLSRRLLSEFLGTLILVAAVVGSGIMADSLTGDVALALLANTIATGAILYVLITLLGPLSGAQFNPAVTLAFALRREGPWSEALPYIAAQSLGGICGSLLAHRMFDLPIAQLSTTLRTGTPIWLSEIVATSGLILTILIGLRHRAEAIPMLVGLYITSAYWFTASTSFANPAVSLGRAFSDTFAGIRPADLPGFFAAQLVGVGLALIIFSLLFGSNKDPRS